MPVPIAEHDPPRGSFAWLSSLFAKSVTSIVIMPPL